MRVIGTAGHVDHGKSTLVRRLTGIDPDRLAEEKAREMTIDLGFAWFTLPDGQEVGVVDVPGHRDFIENMLAGVGGIDAVLLVIAADEGVMPQTREHLAILDLLGIANGLIVLTKTDMIDDEDWLALIEADVRDALRGTTLADAPILPVSAHTGAGIDRLMSALTDLLIAIPPRPDHHAPRLPIDRVFTMSGFGTVVTGTLMGGTLGLGDEVELQPSGLRGRVRGLQSYNHAVERARPGSRVAVNIAGVERRAVERGEVLARPGLLQPTLLTDARFRQLPDTGRPLKHDAEVKLFVGAAETVARVRLLDAEVLEPGMEGWLQLRLETPLALAQGDRFILRYPSPGQTIGGGVIVNPLPARRWKRFQTGVIADLETRMQGTPAERVTQAAFGLEPVKRAAAQRAVGYDEATFNEAVDAAVAQNLLVVLSDGTLLARASLDATLERLRAELDAFHRAEPLRMGMSREELRSRIGLKNATLMMLLEMQSEIVTQGNLVRLAGHSIRFSRDQQAQAEALLGRMNAAPYTPPSYTEAAQMVGEPVLRALIDLGEIVQAQPEVIFTRASYDTLVEATLHIIDTDGGVSAAALRDRFNTTRKYAIGLLEHLDTIGVTKRVGDDRVRAARR
jgi:selenocysteine-specific elongation factor